MAISVSTRALAHHLFVRRPSRTATISSPLRRPRSSPTPSHLRSTAPTTPGVPLSLDGVEQDFSGCRFPPSLDWLWSLSPPARDDGATCSSAAAGSRWGHPSMRRGSFGVVLEFEGVVVEDDDPELEAQVWLVLCEEEGKPFPTDIVFRAIEGMKAEEAMSRVFNWSDDPIELRRLVDRKGEIYRRLRGVRYHLRPGTHEFLSRLVDCSIPMAVASARPRGIVEEALEIVGLKKYFTNIVAAEDVNWGKPEPEMFERAAELIEVEPKSCVVIGNSDATAAAAASAGMRSVLVASNRPVYDFRSEVRVVRWLDELSVVELERLDRYDPIKQRAMERHMEIVM